MPGSELFLSRWVFPSEEKTTLTKDKVASEGGTCLRAGPDLSPNSSLPPCHQTALNSAILQVGKLRLDPKVILPQGGSVVCYPSNKDCYCWDLNPDPIP